MNWELLTSLLVTAGLTIAAWFVLHLLAARRDLSNKRRELRLNILLQAYRALEFAANRPYNAQSAPPAEQAFADILLLGTAKQVDSAMKLMKEFGERQTVDWQPLLLDLRRDLRAELKLDSVRDDILHLRYEERKLDV
jgi:hypothetical protein